MNREQTPLYSSRITNIYLDYLAKYYPQIDVDDILRRSNMTRYEVADPGHWFTQQQVDRFQEAVTALTGNSNIAREAGRFTAYAKSVGAVRQYGLGLMSPLPVYLMVEHFYRLMTKAAVAVAKKRGPNQVEISVTPKAVSKEKPYQCENRKGTFESLAKAFTGRYAQVTETECYHQGADQCRYLIRWTRTPALAWRRLRNVCLLSGVISSLILVFVLPFSLWMVFALSCLGVISLIGYRSEVLERRALAKTIENQGDAAKELVKELNVRHSRAMLVQEIGQVTANIIGVDRLIHGVIRVIKAHLHYDRGIILLSDPDQGALYYQEGYGFSDALAPFVKQQVFPLDRQRCTSIPAQVFVKQEPVFYNNAPAAAQRRTADLAFFEHIGSGSFVCVPIVYEKQSLGVLILDSQQQSDGRLAQSDVSLLIGVAAHIAVGVNNAQFFEKLKKSERELQRSRDDLEIRVAKRTSELAAANRELNLEIEERQKTEQQMLATIKEKDILIKEVHHRVKNNLQIIASLLDMSRRRASLPETIDSLAGAHAKIFTMSLIHTQLYQSDRFDEIDMQRYLRNLTSHLTQLYEGGASIETVIDAAGIFLPVTQAIPCALALNEMISNSLKYAFNGHPKGLISIRMKRQPRGGSVRLCVQDNGCGIPRHIDIEKTDTLGFKLIRNLIRLQLNGRLEIDPRQGTRFDIVFDAA